MLTARSSEDGGEATELSGRGGRCFLVAAMRGAERGRDRGRGWDWDTLVCCPTNTAQCPSYNNMQSYQPCCHTVTTPINISQPLFIALIMNEYSEGFQAYIWSINIIECQKLRSILLCLLHTVWICVKGPKIAHDINWNIHTKSLFGLSYNIQFLSVEEDKTNAIIQWHHLFYKLNNVHKFQLFIF